MSYAVLFSGQASQHPNMLPWLESEPACQPTLAHMVTHVGADWRAQLQSSTTRANNAFAQVLITGTALAAWAAVYQYLPTAPSVVAGYSVGELPAFGCASVLTSEQAMALAVLRARLMDQAVAHVHTGLMAVTGLSEELVLRHCAGLGLECAIRVGSSHQVFAGTDTALTQALTRLSDHGAACTRLDVRVASHSSWMISASSAYEQSFDAINFKVPACAVALNVSGQISRQPAHLRDALAKQLACTVQWSSVMDAVAERQVACVLEVGGGAALSRMWNERHPHIPARALDDFRHPQGAAKWLSQHAVSPEV